jgi:hypothetical protein
MSPSWSKICHDSFLLGTWRQYINIATCYSLSLKSCLFGLGAYTIGLFELHLILCECNLDWNTSNFWLDVAWVWYIV